MMADLIDVRQPSEFASSHIEGSRLVPLRTLSKASADWGRSKPLILVCKSGMRAGIARTVLARQGFTSLSVLQGGVDGWRAAGKPLVSVTPAHSGKSGRSSLDRQVRIVSGAAVLLTLLLASLVSPLLFILTALVVMVIALDSLPGCGIVSSLLARLPWNRQPDASQSRIAGTSRRGR